MEELHDAIDLPFLQAGIHVSLLGGLVGHRDDLDLLAQRLRHGGRQIVHAVGRRDDVVRLAVVLVRVGEDISRRLGDVRDGGRSVGLGGISRIVHDALALDAAHGGEEVVDEERQPDDGVRDAEVLHLGLEGDELLAEDAVLLADGEDGEQEDELDAGGLGSVETVHADLLAVLDTRDDEVSGIETLESLRQRLLVIEIGLDDACDAL
mmetsp:Transcript_23416/g.65346  ORF Transcript_23416/g.65346 Transcript_23416/m.65346 type:complete len:208 (+) Transcript_23416:427-1050(+)